MKHPFRSVASGLALAFTGSAAVAQVDLPNVFGDHMVLQRGEPLPVWGWAAPRAEVVVSVAGSTARAMADEEGAWRAELPALAAGGPFEMTVASAGHSVVFRDVLVGEVWIASGQSNMAWPLSRSQPGLDDVPRPFDPELRVMVVELAASNDPVDDVPGSWARSDEGSLAEFTAVGYAMAARLREELGVPVGVIHTAFGGSPAEAWMPRTSLGGNPDLEPILERMHEQEAQYAASFDAWRAEVERSEAEGRDPPPEPASPFGWLGGNGYKPGQLWNAMLRPLAPFRVAGIAWYQGESNTGRAYQYRTLLPAMIEQWREVFEDQTLPFGIVQLTNWAEPNFPPDSWSWPELREAQAIAADSDENAGLIVTIDVGNPTDLHPRNKTPIGERLALWALDHVYEHDVVSSGPRFTGMRVEGNRAILSFDHVGAGLTTSDGGPPRGFVITENHSWWDWANAEIVGDTVVLTGNWMDNPIAVRYGWADNPEWTNLINREGLPAAPFRTDDLPGVTRDAR